MEIRIFNGKVPADAAEIRKKVFVEEQGFRDEFDEFDAASVHLVLYTDEGAAATMRFYDEGGGSAHAGRVAVNKEMRGQGLGKVLMNEAFDIASGMGFVKMTVGAQEDKAGFYESCGFSRVGDRYFEQDYPHVSMEISLAEKIGGNNSV